MNTPRTPSRLHTLCAALAVASTLLTLGGIDALADHAVPQASRSALQAKAQAQARVQQAQATASASAQV